MSDVVLNQIPIEHIREAAEQVASALGRDCDRTQAREHLAALGKAIAARANGADPGVAPEPSPAWRHLLPALCLQVIRGWAQSETPLEPAVAARTFQAFDELAADIQSRTRDEFIPTSDEDFARQLSAPSGLELVVEVAHDLRSPLTSILFLAETLQRGQSGEVTELQHRQLGSIYSAALGLSTLASNVMELARGGNRLTDDQPGPFSVRDVFESVADIVRPMAEEKGLTIRLLPPSTDHRIGPAQALSRVLLNLTTNAIKFTEEGFVEIVAKPGDLHAVEFSVRDTGHGIAPEAMETLFQPFRRAPREGRLAFSGTGLGLALCRKLVNVMGSTLRFETGAEWGTRFYFDLTLPLATHRR